MRALISVMMAVLMVLTACSSDDGDEAAVDVEGLFDGNPIAGGDQGGESSSEGDSAGDETDPGRVYIDAEELIEELVGGAAEAPDGGETGPTPTEGEGDGPPPLTNSLREGLEQTGIPSEQAGCIVDSIAGSLGLTAAEVERSMAAEELDPRLVDAMQTALEQCVVISPDSGAGPQIGVPADSGSLTEQLLGLGLTEEEAACLGNLTAGGDDPTDLDIFSCVSMSRLQELAAP